VNSFGKLNSGTTLVGRKPNLEECTQLERTETEVKERKNKATENTHWGVKCDQTKLLKKKEE
jgi:hypothetical protein